MTQRFDNLATSATEKSSLKKEPPIPRKGKTPTSISKPSRLPIISLIIALIAIASTLYLINSNQQDVNILLLQIDSLKDHQRDQTTQFDTTLTATKQAEESLQLELSTLKKQLLTIQQQSMNRASNWILFKARYCLELAQINAQWSDNSDTTLALLEQANSLLASRQDQASFNVRQAITKEISQLKGIPKLDIPGMLSQLDATADLINTLNLKPVVLPLNANTPTTQMKASAWREYLKQSLNALQTLVVVRHHDEAINPMPSPAYESLLRDNIRFNLQQAQWAILKSNDAVYQHALTQALKQINQAFKSDTTEINLITHQLQTLQKIHLTQHKPVLETSLLLLNQLIEAKDAEISTAAGEKSL